MSETGPIGTHSERWGRRVKACLLVYVILGGAGVLAGCSNVKQAIGIEKLAPDEMAVNPRENDLIIPPQADVLPPPCQKGKGLESTAPTPNTPKVIDMSTTAGGAGSSGALTPEEKAMLDKISEKKKQAAP